MNGDFAIPLNGLTPGLTEFNRSVAGEFFEEFGNEEILDAQIDVKVSITKSGSFIGIDVDIVGWVVVRCDRCLEDLRMPVDTSARLSVKFGTEPAEKKSSENEFSEGDSEGSSSKESEDSDREVIYLPQDEAVIDLGQVVYDYVCLSLPMQRHHADGECNPAALKYLSSDSVSEPTGSDSPFAALKGLFDN